MTTRAREVCRELLEELKHGAALQAHLANDPVLSESMRQSYARVAGINHDRASALSALIAECETRAGYVSVPTASLELYYGLLSECDKHTPITGSSFDTDMDLALAQLRVILNAAAAVQNVALDELLSTPELITGEVGEEKGETK